MISSATVQSAIVLMNRRMKAERGVITFVPVCSSVEDMHSHHLGGTRAAQEWSVRFEETADPHTPPELHGDRLHYWFSSSQAARSRLWKFSNLTPVEALSGVGRTRPVAGRLQFFERGDRGGNRAFSSGT